MDGSAQKDNKKRLSKARNTFANLRSVWRSSVYSIRTKLNLYNRIVKYVLLYGSDCWQVVKTAFHKMKACHNTYAGSVAFFGSGPSQILSCTPKQIPSQFRQQLNGVDCSDIF